LALDDYTYQIMTVSFWETLLHYQLPASSSKDLIQELDVCLWD